MRSIGESAIMAILWHIEQNSQLKLTDIMTETEQFLGALKKILGPGAVMMERIIVRQIVLEFKIPGSVEGLSEALKLARRRTDE